MRPSKHNAARTTPQPAAVGLIGRRADGFSRRDFLGLLAASAAAVPGCRRMVRERIVPYVRRPDAVRPGEPTTYATSMVLDGYATGLLIACREDRPIKVEGNPDHPASLGAAGAVAQASLCGLYDNDRARDVTFRGRAASWQGARRLLGDLRGGGGEGLRILMPPSSSPWIGELVSRVARELPAARFVFYSAMGAGQGWPGGPLSRGQPLLELLNDFSRADVVLSLDADFLAQGPFWLRYARQWATRRDPETAMSRLYCAESAMSVTGSMADHRLAVRPSEIVAIALGVAADVSAIWPGVNKGSALAALLAKHRTKDPWISAVARDLVRAAGRGVVLAGPRQPPVVHATAHLLNQWLGNQGKTAWTIASPQVSSSQAIELAALVEELGKGKVKALLALNGNPAYAVPAEREFARLAAGVPTSLYLGDYLDETAQCCQWFVPAAHDLESWGDARALDGTVSLMQPVIAGLREGRTPAEILLALLDSSPIQPREALRQFWRRGRGAAAFEAFWEESLRAGLLKDTAFKPVDASIDEGALVQALSRLPAAQGEEMELNLLPDPNIHDGRFAQNAWLQELPDPITRMCWGNAALLGGTTAARLGVADGDVVELALSGRKLRLPVLIAPGHVERAVTVHLGYGQLGRARTARGVGASAATLRTLAAPWFASGLVVRPTGHREYLTVYQLTMSQHDRPLALHATLAQYRQDPERFASHRSSQTTLYPKFDYTGAQWVMSIDLGLCIGCQACVVACQAENNVPVVGAHEIRRGRAMHWLRVDGYLGKPGEAIAMLHQPMPCQHCENAPCEYVCPVNATVHSPDGLNEMVYNRCVGTRFCSNNCPYKVRRFNWFNWYSRQELNQGSLRLQRNPEVSVRDRGVMEKCTYCVQRIRRAEIAARLEDRAIGPGEVRTACQQACPTGAIAFASLSHPESLAVQRRHSKRAYELLHEQGTRPRTWYLARIINSNPELT